MSSVEKTPMKRFELVFKKSIIVKAESLEEAMSKVDGGEVIRAGFKTKLTGHEYDHFELPDYTLIEVDKYGKPVTFKCVGCGEQNTNCRCRKSDTVRI